jgi:ribosomal protein S4
MTKIIKSHYKLIKNFQEDVRGGFLFKMKRRQRTLNLLAWRFVLNKVKPVRLDDLLLPRLKRRALNSHYTIQMRKLRYFYGFYKGYRSVFFKRLHAQVKHFKFNRPERLGSLLELRLDIILVRLRLFSNVYKARRYLSEFGVLVDDRLVKSFKTVLRPGQILSVKEDHKLIFKYKMINFLNPGRLVTNNINDLLDVGAVKVIDLELSRLTTYVRSLHLNRSKLLGNKAIFFNSAFPRYFEVNFRTFEFFCCSGVDPSNDISFPFKTRTGEIQRLVGSLV